MALSKEETIAVIAGSIAGFIVLLSVLSAIIYCCLKRRERDQRKSGQKPFRHHHLTPDTSLSKNSGPHQKHGDERMFPDTRLDPRLDPRSDPRLPKVGSNSLWFGTPSMYSASPSQVYQDMKRKGSDRPTQEQLGLQGPPGHMVYQGPNLGSRIYHSQQVVPAVYEPNYRLPRTGSYMDLYSYPYTGYDPYRDVNNSRAMLMSHPEHEEYYLDRYREREVRRTGKKVRRSQSDVTLHSTRRPKNKKKRKETPFEKEEKSTRSRDSEDRSSSDRYEHNPRRSQSNDREFASERTIVADVHRQKKPAPAPPKPKPKREEIQSKSMDFSDPEISESATDSAKLRALERERNREMERAGRRKNEEYIKKDDFSVENRGFVDDNGASDLNVRPYNYEGKPSMYESSIVAKMAAMADTPKATYISKQIIIDNKGKPNEKPPSKEAFHAEVSKKLEKLQDRTVPPLDLTEGPVATSTGNHSRASRPTSAKRRSRRGSNLTDQDGNVITEQAFQFLDGYSDGEGTDFVESGSITPTLVKDYDINL